MASNFSRKRAAIVSTAQTRWRPSWSNAQHIDLISSVVQRALKGCGLQIKDVDFVIDSGSDVLDGRSISNCGFLGAMGAHHKEESRVEDDGLWAALYGVNKIASGAADIGLIIAYSKPSESDVSKFYSTMADPFCQRPVGLDEVTASGLLAQQYLHDYGIGEEELAEVAASAWQRARANTHIEFDSIPTRSDVMASPLIASPLRELMMARPVDGAVAIVLASEDFAQRIRPSPVWVTGMGAAMDSNVFAMRRSGFSSCSAAARMAYKRAGVTPESIDLAEVSATSAVGELLTLEALGLAEPGRAIDLFRGARGASINRSGGSLPANPIMATGLVRLAEAAEQLWAHRTGDAPPANNAVVHASSGIGSQSHCVFVVEV
jgi:acetyl-CoA C-acetyltransferase